MTERPIENAFAMREAARYVDPVPLLQAAVDAVKTEISETLRMLTFFGFQDHGIARDVTFNGEPAKIWRYVYFEPSAEVQKRAPKGKKVSSHAIGLYIDESVTPYEAKLLITDNADSDTYVLLDDSELEKLGTVILYGTVAFLKKLQKHEKRKPWDA